VDSIDSNSISSLGMIQLVRYHSSPIGKCYSANVSNKHQLATHIGPYDELLYIPGNMTYIGASTVSGLSMTRVYVSSVGSIINGMCLRTLALVLELTLECWL
jgi:hypothetical protein